MEFVKNDLDDYLEGGKYTKIMPLKRFKRKEMEEEES
jgi:hypothetical protein